MKISDKQVQGAVQSFLRQVNRTEKIPSADSKTVTTCGDRVNLSPEAAEMQKVRDMIKSLPDRRPELVEQIKAALAAGEYRVDAADVAEMIIWRSIADRLE